MNLDAQVNTKAAPRKDDKASESVLQQNAKLNVAANLVELSSRLEYKGRNVDELSKIAELRSFLQEDMKRDGTTQGSMADTLKRFDKHFEDPRNLEAVLKDSSSLHELKLPARKTQEQEQGL